MITEQVVTYIKDQLSRGMTRDKIRANLISAGWMAADIDEAFSFANPAGESATLKIAPAFAVQDDIVIQKPIDKTKLVADSNPVMPILKKDEPIKVETPIVASPAAVSIPEQRINVMPSNPMPSMATEVSMRPLTRNDADIVRTFGDDGEIKKPKASSALKFIAALLFILLIVGNLYLWMFSGSNTNNKTEDTQSVTQVDQNNAEISQINNVNQNINISPIENLKESTEKLQLAATVYFSKYNTYGGESMPLGSCAVSSTVFSDSNVKSALNDLGSKTGRVPQCALVGDSAPASKVRTVGYVVYIPMEEAGYCVDSTGAAIVVPKTPTGTTCTEGL